jgi:hypothetical protein
MRGRKGEEEKGRIRDSGKYSKTQNDKRKTQNEERGTRIT